MRYRYTNYNIAYKIFRNRLVLKTDINTKTTMQFLITELAYNFFFRNKHINLLELNFNRITHNLDEYKIKNNQENPFFKKSKPTKESLILERKKNLI